MMICFIRVLSVSALFSLAVTVSAFGQSASNPVSPVVDDRVVVGDPGDDQLTLIKSSKNFELACKVEFEGEEHTVWIDQDFGGKDYRVAMSLPAGFEHIIGLLGITGPVVGIEVTVASAVTSASDPSVVSIDVVNLEDPSKTDPIKLIKDASGNYSIETLEDDGTVLKGVCAANTTN